MKEQILDILTDLRPEFYFGEHINFIKEGMIDSYDMVLLVSELDKRFEISIDGMDIIPENFSSLNKIVELLTKNGVRYEHAL